MNPLIPQPDFIPVSWGWLQFLLLLTLPLHLLAMNAMLGGLAVAVVEHLRGGEVRRQLAHRVAVALPRQPRGGSAAVRPGAVRPVLLQQLDSHGQLLVAHRSCPDCRLLRRLPLRFSLSKTRRRRPVACGGGFSAAGIGRIFSRQQYAADGFAGAVRRVFRPSRRHAAGICSSRVLA